MIRKILNTFLPDVTPISILRSIAVIGAVTVFFRAAGYPGCRLSYSPDSGKAEIRIAGQTPPYKISEQGGWSTVAVDGYEVLRTTEPDKPELPYIVYRVSIPRGINNLSVGIESGIKILPLKAQIKPVPRPVAFIPGNKPPVPVAGNVYSSENQYPAESYSYSITRAGSTYILEFYWYMFRYKGSDNSLAVYTNPLIIISFDAPEWAPNPNPKNAVDRSIKKIILNPDESFFGAPLR